MNLRSILIGSILMTIFLVGCSQESDYGQLEETIKILTSDEMDGRLTGTKGNDLALSFIEEKFREIGLEPLIADAETLLLQYPHKFHDLEKAKFQIQMISDSGDATDMIRGVDYLERTGYSSYEKTLPFTFDVQSPEIEQAYVVVKDRNSFQEAFEKSQGVFIVEEAFSKSLLIDTVDKPIIQISKDVYNRLKKISSGQIMINMSTEEEMIDAFNIAGKIPGKDNDNAIVLSAHFDHVGTVGDSIYRGAIDNASGVAVLLEIAKALGSSPEEFDSDIIIVAFNGEESGLQGSYHLAKELSDKYNSIYNINLDSLYKAPISIVSREGEVSDDLLGDLISVLKENSVDLNTDLSGGLTSDHSNFLFNHINALTISSQNVTPKIHHPLDTIEEIDFPSLLKITDSIIQFINDCHHKEYPDSHDHDHDHENLSQEDEEIHSEFYQTERAKLNHNEYVYKQNPKNDIYYFIANEDYTFTDLLEFKKYYPKIKYNPIIDEYHINSISVFNLYSEGIDMGELEEEKVYTQELSSDDVLLFSFRYSSINDEKQKLHVDISKETSRENTELDEVMVIKDIPYTLLYSSNKDYLLGFSYHQEVNGLTYVVSIVKGEEVVSEFEGRQTTGMETTLTKEGIRGLIEDIKIHEFVQKTIKSF
ncbi:Zn-dependent exopeptidase M28 [Sporosarcina sp. Sa2YVA2]|uniref:Zn-dependent exopeptidase M28 n=2 Tax=Sporosarcina quadrami TaxID=2762234 RepID=A0ABR8UBM5_9BACL|nr:Zn-dependent exopeptidase M28 [Sporosarcina quadrami]